MVPQQRTRRSRRPRTLTGSRGHTCRAPVRYLPRSNEVLPALRCSISRAPTGTSRTRSMYFPKCGNNFPQQTPRYLRIIVVSSLRVGGVDAGLDGGKWRVCAREPRKQAREPRVEHCGARELVSATAGSSLQTMGTCFETSGFVPSAHGCGLFDCRLGAAVPFSPRVLARTLASITWRGSPIPSSLSPSPASIESPVELIRTVGCGVPA